MSLASAGDRGWLTLVLYRTRVLTKSCRVGTLFCAFDNGPLGTYRPPILTSGLPVIRELIVTSAFIDADHKLISNQKARDSQYAVSCSSIAGMRRRS